MPAIATKHKVLKGLAEVITYQRNPSQFILRVKLKGRKAYMTESLVASSLEEAIEQAPITYAGMSQPRLVVEEKPLSSSSIRTQMGSAINLEVTTHKNSRGKSEPIRKTMEDFIRGQRVREMGKHIEEDSIDTQEKILLRVVLPYLDSIGVKHSRQIKLTTFDKFDEYRNPTSKSKLTRKSELQVIKQWISWQLVKHELIDPAIAISKQLIPYERIKQSDLLSNPAINDEDWIKIRAQINRWIKKGEQHHDHRVLLFRKMFYAFFMFLKSTGIRPGEARRVKWKNIQWETETDPDGKKRYVAHIFLPAPITKTKVARDVATAGRGGDALRRWWLQLHEYQEIQHNSTTARRKVRAPQLNDLVFGMPDIDYRCSPYPTISHKWVKEIREPIQNNLRGHRYSDKNYTIYSLRSTFIEDCLDRRVDAWLVSKFTGHDIRLLMKHYERLDIRSRSREITDIDYGKKKIVRQEISIEDLIENEEDVVTEDE